MANCQPDITKKRQKCINKKFGVLFWVKMFETIILISIWALALTYVIRAMMLAVKIEDENFLLACQRRREFLESKGRDPRVNWIKDGF